MSQILEIKSSLEFPSITFDDWGRRQEPLPSLPKRRYERKSVRSQVEIEASILETCRTANVQHWIMVKARLGYDTFWKHMNALLARGLIDEKSEGSRTVYQTSAKGLDLLVKLSAIESTIIGI